MSAPVRFGTVRGAMDVKKAVITAAGRHQRSLPLQTLVDRDGQSRTVLRVIIAEALDAGVEEVAVVVSPGDEAAFAAAAGDLAPRLQFLPQTEARGFGHAVTCARDFVGQHAFLLLVGDHVYVHDGPAGCARQLVEVARREACAVSAVQPTHESKLPYYGVVGGRRTGGAGALYEITDVAEKPTPTEAEQRFVVPGLRTGHYLCYFGMHVLTPAVFGILERQLAAGTGPVALSPALAELARRERCLAFEAAGRRYDLGGAYGLLHAQLALALAGHDRDEVLSGLVELLAQHRRAGA